MTLQSKIESLQFKQAAIDAQIGDLEQKLVFEGHEAEITAYRALQAKLKEATS
jgi:hypothetical protein